MSVGSDHQILVAIASYRDPECAQTIRDLFAKANIPKRVFVAVFSQCDLQRDADCLVASINSDQIREEVVHPSEAKGPCWARSRLDAMWRGESYLLRLDSHMRFRPDWDQVCIDMLKQCPSDRPILTTYPPPYWLPNRLTTDSRPRLLRARRFDADRILRVRAAVLSGSYRHPIQSAFLAAGFSFSESHVLQAAPYDPYLEELFFGEEISLAARLWTHGYDFFAPHEHIVYHLWQRSHRPLFWENNNQEKAINLDRSQRRVRYLLRTDSQVSADCLTELQRFGLGTLRTLDEYQEFSGVDFSRLTISQQAAYGGYPPVLVEPVK